MTTQTCFVQFLLMESAQLDKLFTGLEKLKQTNRVNNYGHASMASTVVKSNHQALHKQLMHFTIALI